VKTEPSLLKSIIKTEESMKITRRTVTLGGLSTGFAAASGLSLTSPASAQSLSPTEARQIAEDAYIYGYWPKETSPSILNGSWEVPPVVKAS
jgi:hypothetical protein